MSTSTFRDRITSMYARYDPQRLANVDLIMEQYAGEYDDVMKQLVEKYGPEPTTTMDATTDNVVVDKKTYEMSSSLRKTLFQSRRKSLFHGNKVEDESPAARSPDMVPLPHTPKQSLGSFRGPDVCVPPATPEEPEQQQQQQQQHQQRHDLITHLARLEHVLQSSQQKKMNNNILHHRHDAEGSTPSPASSYVRQSFRHHTPQDLLSTPRTCKETAGVRSEDDVVARLENLCTSLMAGASQQKQHDNVRNNLTTSSSSIIPPPPPISFSAPPHQQQRRLLTPVVPAELYHHHRHEDTASDKFKSCPTTPKTTSSASSSISSSSSSIRSKTTTLSVCTQVSLPPPPALAPTLPSELDAAVARVNELLKGLPTTILTIERQVNRLNRLKTD
eukprot:PhM_4_TR6796/c0_g1_i1/m.84858